MLNNTSDYSNARTRVEGAAWFLKRAIEELEKASHLPGYEYTFWEATAKLQQVETQINETMETSMPKMWKPG
jgi:hypothetical protein